MNDLASRPRPSLRELPPPPAGRTGWPWTEECAPLPATRADSSPWPTLSVVTPVYNQAQFLEETLRSVLLQGYPELDYVVINDGSTDDSEQVIRRYAPFLSYWETQPNQGQRAAINRGFEHARGQMQCYLNSDDLFLPGALERAARELDPARGRHIVMGRCRFTDPEGHFIGVEHPSRFTSHARVLQIWKGHTIPQPSVFWTEQVWRECGPIREDSWVDYGLFARFSKRYRFHPLDQVLSTYRLHAESKTQVSGEERRLAETVAISRTYWGPPWHPRHLRLQASLTVFRWHRRGRAVARLRQAAEAQRLGQRLAALGHGAVGALLGPEVVFRSLIFPALRRAVPGALHRVVQRCLPQRDTGALQVYLDHTSPWPDGWVGPRLELEREAGPGSHVLALSGSVELRYLKGPLALRIRVDDHDLGRQELTASGAWSARLEVRQPLGPGPHRVVVEASEFFVPHEFLSNDDRRPLSWHLDSLELVG